MSVQAKNVLQNRTASRPAACPTGRPVPALLLLSSSPSSSSKLRHSLTLIRCTPLYLRTCACILSRVSGQLNCTTRLGSARLVRHMFNSGLIQFSFFIWFFPPVLAARLSRHVCRSVDQEEEEAGEAEPYASLIWTTVMTMMMVMRPIMARKTNSAVL